MVGNAATVGHAEEACEFVFEMPERFHAGRGGGEMVERTAQPAK